MFATENIQRDGFDLVVLKDLDSNTFAEIIPACGGILHSFSIWHNQQYVNVIDGYQNREDFEKNVASKGFKSCKLSPFACRVKDATYRFEEHTYTINKFLLNGSALHGLIYDAAFTITYQYANEEHAGLAIEYKYRGADKGFPFHYDCVVTYHLKKNNELQVTTDIFNRYDGLMPVQDGWHPYFTLGGKIDDLLLQFKSRDHLQFDAAMIPTGRIVPYSEFVTFKKIEDKKFDDCYTLNFGWSQPLVALRDEKQQLQVEILPGKSYPYLQLYTPPGRNSIAIENLSAPPDTFNNGISLVILPPDANMVFTTAYRITAL